jgi:GH15 family glucan-1,4-alpha-glucosidase
MGRPVILSNGRLAVALDCHGLVHDFYYPYVGLENLTTARSVHHKIGVWVDGMFSWVDDGTWEISVDFETDALISIIKMKNTALQLQIEFNDMIDPDYDVFVRYAKIYNQSENTRDIRLFMHQVFQISSDGRADTALYNPDKNYVLDYKGRCVLMVSGQTDSGSSFDQFSVGNYGIEGKEGTFRDAEDGELSGNPVEHGGVDSVIRFSLSVQAGQYKTVQYYVVASDLQYNGEKILGDLMAGKMEDTALRTRSWWKNWLAAGSNQLHSLDPKYLNITKKSLMMIKAHCDERGGMIASLDSSIYNYSRDYYSYVWPRDTALSLMPLVKLGFYTEAEAFLNFCADTISPKGYMQHKYQPDRSIGSTWHPMIHGEFAELPIQEDESALVVLLYQELYKSGGMSKENKLKYYHKLVRPIANFISQYIDVQTGLPHASYDLWEQKFATHTFTVATAYAALLAAKDVAIELKVDQMLVKVWLASARLLMEGKDAFYDYDRKQYRKSIRLDGNSGTLELDNTLDVSSVWGVMRFGYYDSLSDVFASWDRIIEVLSDKSPSGGVPRFEHDQYYLTKPQYMGNPWIVCTLWLSNYYAMSGRKQRAEELIDWCLSTAMPSGVMAEQIDPEDRSQVSVAPLVWSHAELINAVLLLA